MQRLKRTFTYKLLAAMTVLLVAVGCGKVKDISITSCDLKSISPNGMRAVDVVLAVGVHNPTIAFTLDNVTGTVYNDERSYVSFAGGPVSVYKKSDEVYDLPCSAMLEDNVSLFQVLGIVKSKDFKDFKLDVSGDIILANGMKKTLTFKDISVEKLLESSGYIQ